MAFGLLRLPPELLVDVLGRLPASDIVSLRSVGSPVALTFTGCRLMFMSAGL